MIHNLRRPVVASALEFHTDQDAGAVSSIKPVFNKTVKEYTVYVHELATRVYPLAHPEDGAQVIFGEGRYVDSAGLPLTGENGIELPPVSLGADGAYPFPINVSELLVTFSIYKEHREDSGYTVLISRRGSPSQVGDIKITVAEWAGPPGSRYRGSFADLAAIDAAINAFNPVGDPVILNDYAFSEGTETLWMYDGVSWTDTTETGEGEPGHPLWWNYETENFMVNFDAAGLEYDINIPYYAEKVLITPVVESDIITSYKLYPQNPRFFPEHSAAIEYTESASPQVFDFTRNAEGAVYQNPQLRIGPPLVDAVSGLKTTYLHVITAVKDPPNEPRYPATYKFKISWDKSLAYLKGLRVEDDVIVSEQRLQGNFVNNNSS
ncbi:MAG: hypothetical protein LBH73_02850, partial [Spirochaetaceae bacterium]|nr:hypothetical protein [Spirochaetaceae bacterium]